MNVSELIVRYLRALGVRHFFGYPGDPSVVVAPMAKGVLAEDHPLYAAQFSMWSLGVGVGTYRLALKLKTAFLTIC